jgi:ABC-type nitrate/sulfonate/bicarbonate transport system permease component
MTANTLISRSGSRTISGVFSRAAGSGIFRGRTGTLVAVVIDVAIVYVIWEILSVTGILPGRYFPDANTVIGRFGYFLRLRVFWHVVGYTLESWAIGLVLASVIGTIVGIILGSSDRAYRFCRVVIEVMRPVPPIVLLPLILLVLGATLEMKLALILQGTLWLLILQAIYGVRAVDSIMLETGRSYGLSRRARFLHIQLPGSLPFIVTGIRIASIFALVVSIVSELIGGAPGLGNEILRAESTGDDPTMYALILATGILGVFITLAFGALERRILFWHPSHRAEVH